MVRHLAALHAGRPATDDAPVQGNPVQAPDIHRSQPAAKQPGDAHVLRPVPADRHAGFRRVRSVEDTHRVRDSPARYDDAVVRCDRGGNARYAEGTARLPQARQHRSAAIRRTGSGDRMAEACQERKREREERRRARTQPVQGEGSRRHDAEPGEEHRLRLRLSVDPGRQHTCSVWAREKAPSR